jgi:hypothetical protein
MCYKELYIKYKFIVEQNKKLRNQLRLTHGENKGLPDKFDFKKNVQAEKSRYMTRSVSNSHSPKAISRADR